MISVPEEEEFFASATQVSTFELCPRKWAWRYIDRVEAPPNKFAVLGIDTHGGVEQWLRSRRVPEGNDPWVRLAHALIPHLPPPQLVDPAHVEMDQLLRLSGLDFIVRVDLFMPDLGGRPRVYDHKTTSDLRWALSPEQLLSDVQGTLYAAWALVKTGAPEVDLQWTYVTTRGATRALPVVQEGVTKAAVEERLGLTLDSAKLMRELKGSGCTAIEVPYDAAGCEAYGGCPYQERCNLSPSERIKSVMAQETSKETQAFLAELRARKTKNGATALPPSPPQKVNPPVEAAPPPANAAAQDFLARRAARKAAEAAPPPVVVSETLREDPLPEPPVAKAGPGRPRKEKVDDTWSTWSSFAAAVLPTFAADGTPSEAAEASALYADEMLAKLVERRGA